MMPSNPGDQNDQSALGGANPSAGDAERGGASASAASVEAPAAGQEGAAGAGDASRGARGISALRGLAQRRNARRRLPAWATLAIVVVVALLIEVFVCNFRFWQSRGYQEVVLRDDPIKISSADYSIGFGSLDLDVKNVQIEISGPDDNSSVWVQLAVSDQGESKLYSLPVAQMHQNNARSQIHTVFTYGKVSNMRLTIPGDVYGGVDGNVLIGSNSLPITIERVAVNVPVPFSFVWGRFVMILVACLMVWFLWPSRSAWRIPALSPSFAPTLARTCVLVLTLVTLAVFITLLPRWAGIATSFYNTTKYDSSESAAIQLVGQPDTATNEYGKLAQAFANGQVDLLQEPPQWLVNMEDPYMYGARNAESATHTRGYLWDTAYYDGSYYVYFGVLPCLVFYLPFYLMTGEYFPNSVAVLVATLAFVVGWYSLLRALIQYKFKKTSLAAFILLFVGGVICSGVLFGLGRPGLYNVPVTCGRALVVWGLCMWYRGWHKRSPVRMCVGSLLVACIAATRPQLLVIAPLILVPLILTLRMRTLPRRTKAGWLACLIVPVVAVAAGVMWYNWIRFDSPFDFGAQYNLTYNNMTMRGHSLMRMADGLYYCLVCPPNITDTFPFISHVTAYPSFSGVTIYEPLIGGLLWLNPMLLAIAFVFGLAKRGERRDMPTFLFAVYFALMGIVLVAFDCDNAGILLRYFQDFGILFALSATLVFLYHVGGKGAKLPDEYVAFATMVNGSGGKVTSPYALQVKEQVEGKEAKAAEAGADASDAAGEPGEEGAAAQREAQAVLAVDAERGATCEGPEGDEAGQAGRGRAAVTERDCPRRPAWAIALFVCVMVGVLMAVMSALFMMNPIEGGVSGGGTYPEFWESVRQTFQFWL
jgi:hypothetical protein